MQKTVKPWKEIIGGISAPEGFYASGVKAEIKYKDRYDVALILSKIQANAAGMFTRNLVKAHPLLLTQKFLENGRAQAVIVNSGNANACMGDIGEKAAWQMAETVSRELGIPLEDVVVSSTGVIGQEMPLNKLIPGIKEAVREVGILKDGTDADTRAVHAERAALAIMTTDSSLKQKAMELKCSQGTVKLGIIAKGSGMIHPNMGTMLCFITTDARVESGKLRELLREATEESFNMVTVDGDTSTNDMVVILANGSSGVEPEGTDWKNFSAMVREACCDMAKEIARDGEGASKFLEIRVTGAKTLSDARLIARSICSSSLVKSAMYGQDANWGRILAAAGYSGADFDPSGADIFLNGLQVSFMGQGLQFSESDALNRLKNKDILIEIRLRDGICEAKAWGCDLTHQYIDINASYRT